MQSKKKETLIELLTELRDEHISELAKTVDLSEQDIRDRLASEPEDVYEMDDGNCLLQGIDNVLNAIDI
jgi:hypothetical protein